MTPSISNDGSGPSVRDDERQCVLMMRPHVHEVDIESVDLGDEVRDGRSTSAATRPEVVVGPQ